MMRWCQMNLKKPELQSRTILLPLKMKLMKTLKRLMSSGNRTKSKTGAISVLKSLGINVSSTEVAAYCIERPCSAIFYLFWRGVNMHVLVVGTCLLLCWSLQCRGVECIVMHCRHISHYKLHITHLTLNTSHFPLHSSDCTLYTKY